MPQQQPIAGNSSEASDSSDSSDQLFDILVKNYLLESHAVGIESSSVNRFLLQEKLKLNQPKASLESLDKSLNYKLSTYGTDSLTARSTLLETYTINYLADNSLEKFRLHLRDTLPKNSFSAFLFSKKYAADGLCAPEGSNPTSTDAGYLKYEDSKFIRNPLVDRNAKVEKEYVCAVSKEDLNWSSTFLEGGSSVQKMVGYKGLVSGDWKTHFSEDVVKLIEAKSSYWSDATSLNEYIDNGIKSSAQMDGLIEKLKSIFPTHDWNTVSLSNASYRFDWRSDNRHDLNKLSRDLEARRKGLKDYINRTNLPFKSFHGWLRDDKGGYLVQDSKGDKYSVFLSQIKYDDVSTPEKWKAYLKTINADLIIRELVRASKNPKVQHKAIFDQLLDSQKGLGSIQTGDYRLKEALNYQWFSNAQSS
ncbi:hypothetical protein MHF_1187 [Mycoplasma haemofelis Ohio2]|uniref:Uncharacterized protein n=1 Tax=Mycoplasma haemofelis (strain Ohio2) TaxID=859194 RepID=F6FJS3_MYCHI|nr:hypothetical protein MHF_1187 [Mycoplasma haemofelis Ohio2]